MAVPCSESSLLAEFKSLEIELSGRFYCRATTTKAKNRQCRNQINPGNMLTLRELVPNIISAISTGQADIENELETASSLVMCQTTYHQPRAEAQKENWASMIRKPGEPETRDASQATPDTVGSSLVEPNAILVSARRVDRITQICANSDESHLGPADALSSRRSSVASVYLSAEEDFNDAGCKSADGDDEVKVKVKDDLPADIHVPSFSIKSEYTDGDPFTIPRKPQPRVKSEYSDDDPFTTPNKPLRQFFVDSGISMGFTTPEDSLDTLNAEPVPPSSPLDKFSKDRAQRAKREETRPDATPLQSGHRELESAPAEEVESAGHGSMFIPFKHPSAELIRFLQEPLGTMNEIEGYLYVFQISGQTYNKIGSSRTRKGQSLIKSFRSRMKEQEKVWSKPYVVFQCRVPHAHRVEHILHKYFQKNRLTETLCKVTAGQDCKHENHDEWFDVTLDEIWRVAIAWCHWITSNPYPLLNGNRTLSEDWKKKLAQVEHCEDHWMMWLYLLVPGSHSPEGLSYMEINKTEEEIEKRCRELDVRRKELEEQRGELRKAREEVDKARVVEPRQIARDTISPFKSTSTWNHRDNYENERDSKTKLFKKWIQKL